MTCNEEYEPSIRWAYCIKCNKSTLHRFDWKQWICGVCEDRELDEELNKHWEAEMTNKYPDPPPYNPDKELIGFIEKGQKPMTTRDCIHGKLARSCNICELEGEIKELKAHIERWAKRYPESEFTHLAMASPHGLTCRDCWQLWPCPTEVAKGWEE